MINRLYKFIEHNPSKYNSVELGKLFNVDAEEIRKEIRVINQDFAFPLGIISVNNKYKLTDSGEDFKRKVLHYRAMHKKATQMEQLWLARQDKFTNKGGQ